MQQLETLRQRPKDGGGSGSGVRPSASSASLAGAEGGPEGAGLAQRIAALKAARDKLISALDLQAGWAPGCFVEGAARQGLAGLGVARSYCARAQRCYKRACGPSRGRLFVPGLGRLLVCQYYHPQA